MTGYWDVLVRSAFDRAEQHRPQDRATLRAAAVELSARGLLPADISAALRLSDEAVRELLRVSE